MTQFPRIRFPSHSSRMPKPRCKAREAGRRASRSFERPARRGFVYVFTRPTHSSRVRVPPGLAPILYVARAALVASSRIPRQKGADTFPMTNASRTDPAYARANQRRFRARYSVTRITRGAVGSFGRELYDCLMAPDAISSGMPRIRARNFLDGYFRYLRE